VAAVAAALASSAAAAAPPQRWAGLDAPTVARIARAAVDVYVKAGAGATDPVVIRHYWHGHEAWVIKADFTCAGGNYPTIVLWKGTKPFRPGEYSFMCRAVTGKPIVCRELSVC
jgi:hypothetical protein